MGSGRSRKGAKASASESATFSTPHDDEDLLVAKGSSKSAQSSQPTQGGALYLEKRRLNADDDDDDSDSETEDEDGEELTKELDADISKTLKLIRKKDPAIYDPSIAFFKKSETDSDSDEGEGKKSKKKKGSAPLYYKDLVRQQVIAGDVSGSEEEGGKTANPCKQDEEDAEELEKAEDFEHTYNFRFEEQGSSIIQTHSRHIEDTMRREDDSRKRKRAERKERKALERQKKEEELRRLKNLKQVEIEQKLKKVARLMVFDEQYYDEDDDDMEKPTWDEEEDKELFGGLPVDPDEEVETEESGEKASEESEEEDNEEDNEEEQEQDEDDEKQGDEEVPPKKMTIEEMQREKQKYLDELYGLDYEDLIGDIKCRFKYRQVQNNDFGLTVDEIMAADDKELKQLVSLKRMAPYADTEYSVDRKRLKTFKKSIQESQEENRRRKNKKEKAGLPVGEEEAIPETDEAAEEDAKPKSLKTKKESAKPAVEKLQMKSKRRRSVAVRRRRAREERVRIHRIVGNNHCFVAHPRAMAALPSVAPVSSNSPTVTATVATAFDGRGSRLSRVARRGGAASSLTTGGPTAWTANNEKTGPSSENESDNKMQRSMPSASQSKSSKWSALRREILPSPALMTISAKVQHIIDSLFTTMSEVSAKKLCKEMEFLHLNSGEVIVKQGEKGSTCFILMSGLVSVYVRSPEEQIKHQRLMRSNSVSSSMRRLSAGSNINYGAKVVSLTPGATFGELCLIEPDSKRSATVVVDQQAQMPTSSCSQLHPIFGTITDNIAFLQHLLIFKSWSKMQLMHIVNSMKLVNVSAGHLKVCNFSMGEVRGVQRSITVELTFLGKFDVAGEYIASEKKMSCPVDIRATTDVDCLVLTRKMFMLHFGGKELKPHVVPTRRRLRTIAEAREAWRETRILQALQYPTLRVPITRKLMRLSGNCCLICGRRTHVAGDPLCMELPSYYMFDEKQKKREQKERGRTASKHRISVVSPPSSGVDGSSPARKPTMTSGPVRIDLPSLPEHDREDHNELQSPARLGTQLVSRQWQEAEKTRVIRAVPQRPMVSICGSTWPYFFVMHANFSNVVSPRTTDNAFRKAGSALGVTSITRSSHITRRQEEEEQQRRLKVSHPKTRSIQEELQHIRDTWPNCWDNDDNVQPRSQSRSPLTSPRARPGRQMGCLSART
ncbi:Kri1-like, C-terminal [Phytophthora cactorum]|nr:Kri1-like, C-terminal [Phytophthora cactorum]